MNRKSLAVFLSKLKNIKDDERKEQHQTNSEIAATILWIMHMNGDIEGKTTADFGAGNGIFGIGCLKLNAEKVYFIENDENNLKILEENLDGRENFEIINDDIKNFNEKADVVVQNPPFGVRIKHLDKKFLKKAMEMSDKIYSIHKIESKSFIEKFSKGNNFKAELLMQFDFGLKKQKTYHKKKVHYVKCGVWKLERQ